MALEVKHKFQSAKPDSGDGSIVRPSNWNDDHNFTLGGERLVGRHAAGDGPAQEIPLGDGLEFLAGALRVNLVITVESISDASANVKSFLKADDYDAMMALLKAVALDKEGQELTGGVNVNWKELGNLSGQIISVDPSARVAHRIMNNGPGTIAFADAKFGSGRVIIENINGAGVIAFAPNIIVADISDSLDTTVGSKFLLAYERYPGLSFVVVKKVVTP